MSNDHATAVLYVEDEVLIREFAAMALEDAGFDVVLADSGEAAFDAMDECADPFCAVVTDVNLGAGPDGWAVGRRARELNRALPVVYVTGAHGQEWRANAVPDSVIIAKPFTPTQIVDAVESLLERNDISR